MPTPSISLNNGVEMPTVGFGVFQSPPEETAAAVAEALKVGYRHIDTAAAYGNEKQVGEGIRTSGVPRDEVFIETKIWINDYGFEETLHGFDKSAGKLGVDQIDLMILHQPLPSEFQKTVGAYKALEKLLAEGKLRAIGVSNFMPHHLNGFLDEISLVPAVNQIELHPYFQQAELETVHKRYGILTQAWSPIGGITFYRGSGKSTLEDRTILDIASAHTKSAAQIMLRWGLQHGRSVIPKSVRPDRIAENFDIFDFELTPDQMTAIDGLETDTRGGPDPDTISLENFSRDIPDA